MLLTKLNISYFVMIFKHAYSIMQKYVKVIYALHVGYETITLLEFMNDFVVLIVAQCHILITQ